MTERCTIFIDGGYIIPVMRDEFGGAKIDYLKFSEYIAEGVPIMRTYFYNCHPYVDERNPTTDELTRMAASEKFHGELEQLPNFQVRFGELRRWGRGPRYQYGQKMVDTLISIDLVSLSAKRVITQAILVTGDSDFIPAIKLAKNEGVNIRVVHGLSPHDDLLTEADQRMPIDADMLKAIAP